MRVLFFKKYFQDCKYTKLVKGEITEIFCVEGDLKEVLGVLISDFIKIIRKFCFVKLAALHPWLGGEDSWWCELMKRNRWCNRRNRGLTEFAGLIAPSPPYPQQGMLPISQF